MKQNKLFSRARWHLASWYAGILSIVFLICGLGFYQAIVQAYRISVSQELESVAGTLHDSLLPILKQPEKIEPEVKELLPNTCIVRTRCYKSDRFQSFRVGVIEEDKYYLRLLDLSGGLVAVAGIYPQLPQVSNQQKWETLIDAEGISYLQISYLLHTRLGENWGYLQVGRSLQDFDTYVKNFRLLCWLGVPLVMLLVASASWWLSGSAIRPIYQSYHQMQQFTADAAHELRTPLAAIQAMAQSSLMLPNLPENKSKDTLKSILRQNKKLSYLVADLLTLCRIDGELSSNTYSHKKEKVALANLIVEVEEDLAALAIASEIELISQIEISELTQVFGDRQQLYRLITNLVTNAIQFTPAGGKVALIVTERYNEVIICVRDTGIGIAKKEQKCIFDRFYRVKEARSKSKGGSGLGLAIAKAIALVHQGSLEVHSEIGKGSTFTVKLSKSK